MKSFKPSRPIVATLAAAIFSLVPPAIAASSPALETARQLNQAFIEVADQVSPAVVVITVAHKQGYSDMSVEDHPFLEMLPPETRRQLEEQFRQRQEQPRRRRAPREPVFDGMGSGVVIREDGYILTNGHVIEGADKIRVRLTNGKEYDAELRGTDAQSDIAVIRITDKSVKALPTAKKGDSAKVRVGEFAIAIGAPFELDSSVTFGHVSAKGRSRIIPDPAMDQDFIQTDANINPGNSGGPLVNINGEVIGINTLIRGLRTGIGFAIPSNFAWEVADQLIAQGKFTRAWLGVGIHALKDDPELQAILKSLKEGVVVDSIQKDGPAAKSDLKSSDVITTVDGRPVSDAQQLRNEIRSKRIGATVVLDVLRNGKDIKVKVVTEAWPEEMTQAATGRRTTAVPSSETKGLGVTVKAITQELAQQFGIEKAEGVIVTAVDQGGPAEARGIRPGDVITDVNHQPVKSPADFKTALKDVDLKKGVIVNLSGKSGTRFEILKETEE